MPVKSLKRNLLKIFGVAAAAGLIVGVFAFIYLPDYTRIQEMKRKRRALRGDIAQLRKDVQDLTQKNKLIKDNDPYLLEKLAREQLGMVRENEVVVDVGPSEKKR